MSLSRRSSQQYSLFPTCSPLPVAQPLTPGKRDDSGRDQTRSWSISSASERQAAHILARPEPKETQHHTREGKRSSTDLTILKVIKKLKRQSTTMSRLIPLKLEAVAVTTRMPSQSTTALPVVKTIASPSTSPIYPPKRPEIPSRTSSIQKERSGPATSLTILPYTQEEWAKVMEEVKDLYSKGHYKHCASRCKQMLKSIKDPYRVHPLYSIYLSFFAASALEITASSLHTHSNTKLPLYQEALSFYQRAESFIEYATLNTDPNVIHTSARQSYAHSLGQGGIDHQMIHHSSNSSMSSTNSIHSSVDSIFSRRSSSACSIASTMSPLSEYEPSCHVRRSSSISSRASSESFLPSQQRPKKKVSFSSPLPAMHSENDTSATVISAALLDSFPEPPSESRTRSCSPHTISISPEPRPSPALARYRFNLSDLANQLTYHISSLHLQIAALSSARAPRRDNGPDLTISIITSTIELEHELTEERQKLDIQARIQRLREAGWERKRFDGTRYQLLCEKALDEVAESEMF